MQHKNPNCELHPARRVVDVAEGVLGFDACIPGADLLALLIRACARQVGKTMLPASRAKRTGARGRCLQSIGQVQILSVWDISFQRQTLRRNPSQEPGM